MPADGLVDIGTQAECARSCVCRCGGVCGGIPCKEIRPDDHQLALAEILAIGHRLGNGFTTPCADIAKGAQADTDRSKCDCDLFGIETRHAENARLNAGDCFGSQQRLDAGIFTALIRAADDIGNGLRFGVFSGTFGNTHDNCDRF